MKSRNTKLLSAGILVVVLLGLFVPYYVEPTGAPRYVDVVVDSYHGGGTKGGRYFTVESPATQQTWNVGAHGCPLSTNYVGPAILAVSKGRWTGWNHYNLLTGRPATRAP
jgi:hypothetical protein